MLGKITRSLSLPLSRRNSEQRHPVHGPSWACLDVLLIDAEQSVMTTASS